MLINIFKHSLKKKKQNNKKRENKKGLVMYFFPLPEWLGA